MTWGLRQQGPSHSLTPSPQSGSGAVTLRSPELPPRQTAVPWRWPSEDNPHRLTLPLSGATALSPAQQAGEDKGLRPARPPATSALWPPACMAHSFLPFSCPQTLPRPRPAHSKPFPFQPQTCGPSPHPPAWLWPEDPPCASPHPSPGWGKPGPVHSKTGLRAAWESRGGGQGRAWTSMFLVPTSPR